MLTLEVNRLATHKPRKTPTESDAHVGIREKMVSRFGCIFARHELNLQ